MIAAPPGWGYRPGSNLLDEPVELPDIRGIKKMSSNEKLHAITAVLLDNYKAIETVSGGQIMKRYPEVTRHAAYMALSHARAGNMPGKMGRPSGYKSNQPGDNHERTT